MTAQRSPAARILVTGAAGFIGSHLCERLAFDGRSTIGIDNFDPYYDRFEKEQNVAALRFAGGEFRESDIRDYGALASLFDVVRPDVVVHLAAKAGVRNSVHFPRQYFETNVLGTQNVLDACKAVGIGRLVVASTSSVYGNTTTIPFNEHDPCVEPMHPYAASKRAAEFLCQTYARLYGLQVTITRFFTVYGERGRPDMMPRLLLESVTSGREVKLFSGDLHRDWTHVSDTVSGLVAAVDTPLGFETLNVGLGRPESLASFIAEIERASGRKAVLSPSPRPATEMITTYASTERLEATLGVTPQVSVSEGVDRMWDWWTNRPIHS